MYAKLFAIQFPKYYTLKFLLRNKCMLKRLFDIIVSAAAIIILSSLFIIICLIIKANGRGPVFFTQKRVGKNGIDFLIYKFRTMNSGSEKGGFLTIGGHDSRITACGFYLRKYKLDELPQLFNVLKGDMSLVGPRPEVRKYVEMYNSEQYKVLSVLPGITDYASVIYSDESVMLGKAADPEFAYIHQIMPAKLKLNLKYIREQNFFVDCKILTKTVMKILSSV